MNITLIFNELGLSKTEQGYLWTAFVLVVLIAMYTLAWGYKVRKD